MPRYGVNYLLKKLNQWHTAVILRFLRSCQISKKAPPPQVPPSGARSNRRLTQINRTTNLLPYAAVLLVLLLFRTSGVAKTRADCYEGVQQYWNPSISGAQYAKSGCQFLAQYNYQACLKQRRKFVLSMLCPGLAESWARVDCDL